MSARDWRRRNHGAFMSVRECYTDATVIRWYVSVAVLPQLRRNYGGTQMLCQCHLYLAGMIPCGVNEHANAVLFASPRVLDFPPPVTTMMRQCCIVCSPAGGEDALMLHRPRGEATCVGRECYPATSPCKDMIINTAFNWAVCGARMLHHVRHRDEWRHYLDG